MLLVIILLLILIVLILLFGAATMRGAIGSILSYIGMLLAVAAIVLTAYWALTSLGVPFHYFLFGAAAVAVAAAIWSSIKKTSPTTSPNELIEEDAATKSIRMTSNHIKSSSTDPTMQAKAWDKLRKHRGKSAKR